MKCSKTSWYTAVLTLDLRKHSGPAPADDMAPQTITDCGNFTVDLKQRGLCASPLFLQTLWPWFPKEMQNWLSSENITLDHSAAVQSFLSLAQARRFWRCLLFKSDTRNATAETYVLHTSVRSGSWSTDSSCSPLFVNLPHIFEWVLFHNPLQGAVIHILHFFLPHLFLPFASLLMCLDTELCEQPASFAMTFCVLPSLCKVSMVVFWTTVKSAVFPMKV